MIVNCDQQHELTLSFTAAGMPKSVKEISKETGKEVKADYDRSTGTLNASFQSGDGRLFILPNRK